MATLVFCLPRYQIKKQSPDKVAARGFLARRSTSGNAGQFFVVVQVCFYCGSDTGWNMRFDNFIVQPRHTLDQLIANDPVLHLIHVLDDAVADCLKN